ncbi:MAG TPA: hypothetical protein PKI66_04580 [Methanobacteriaceae archaeon]|nr:hypothetical protein [Methanobacteriaceae archaeon]HNS24489.1 hypothetical protein [Methanobacteriaceae archaeon]
MVNKEILYLQGDVTKDWGLVARLWKIRTEYRGGTGKSCSEVAHCQGICHLPL